MNTILIIYFSGVGNTEQVAKMIFSCIRSICTVSIYSIEQLPPDFDINNYDALILGFPTIHIAPAQPMQHFLSNLSCLTKEVPAFLFTTCGLYSANTLRIFAHSCIKKNIIPILNRSYRCSATDGTLLAPFMKCWFSHEKNLEKKVCQDALRFIKMDKRNCSPVIPWVKWYSALNFLNKWIGKRFPFPLYLHKEKCIQCQKCITDCPVKALSTSADGFPQFSMSHCVHCYRCIHHCPQLALSLSKKNPLAKTIYH